MISCVLRRMLNMMLLWLMASDFMAWGGLLMSVLEQFVKLLLKVLRLLLQIQSMLNCLIGSLFEFFSFVLIFF